MANSPSARKRARQAEKRRIHNHSLKSAMRTAIKKVLKAVKDGDKEVAKTSYVAAQSKIDKLAKGIIHRNTASRLKQRLNAKVKALVTAA